MKSYFYFTLFLAVCSSTSAGAQADRWQQEVKYTIDVDLDHTTHQFTGTEKLVYYNHSPDELTQVFYHLYFNAFQPGSSMDTRSLWIVDPDSRIGDRISKLTPEEYGYLHARTLLQDGKPVVFFENETILEVTLNKPIPPGGKVTFEMTFDGQVPLQIRRSGRDNAEGIDFSMCQWYPKMSEYDCRGWNANPYIGREFYGVWGDFDVSITLDKKFVVGASGYLTNEKEVTEKRLTPATAISNENKVTWNWQAHQVHDFTWAADPDYIVESVQVNNGPLLKFYYQPDPTYSQAWKDAQPLLAKAFEYMNKRFGKYPYDTYSFIQAGDGGMEYEMLTFVTGNRKLPSLVGVSVHEAMHAWYQGALGFDESHYYWMDEGFTSFAAQEVMDYLFKGGLPSGHDGAYGGYFDLVAGKTEEPLSTHADHFNTNNAYGEAAYSKGEIYLCQLGYVIGEKVRDEALRTFFDTWKFHHPTSMDLLRTMEKASGLELDWYHEYFVLSTHTIDYAIQQMTGTEKNTSVVIERKGVMPMPVEVMVTRNDGYKTLYYLPLDIMRGAKTFDVDYPVRILPDWPWVDTSYRLVIDYPVSEIASIEIDPSHFMADVDRSNNRIEVSEGLIFFMKR